MANYSLVAGAQFRPFSYQELMAPIARMNEVQGQLEEQYDALSAQADALEAMGKNDRDKSVYNQYKAFSDALRAEADNLYRNGLTTDSRLRLSEMKRRYSKEIVPILNAWAKRKQEADIQIKAQMANPDLMFTRDANTTSLQDYIDNPEGGFIAISGKNIAAQVGTTAAALAKEIRINPNGETATKLKNLDRFTYETIINRGLTSAEIADWQNNPALRSIVENVLGANGVTKDNLGDKFDSIYRRSLNYAIPALNQAIGETKVGTMENYYNKRMFDFDLSEKAADNAARRKIAEEQAKNGGVGNVNNLVNPLPLRSQQEISDNNTQIQEYIDKGYMVKDVNGNWRMTKEGVKEYEDNKTPRVSTAASGGGTARLMNAETALDNRERPFTPSKFRQFIDAQNGGKTIIDNGRFVAGWGPGKAGNLFAQAIKNNEEDSYDTYHSTEYDRQVPSSYGNTFTEQIWSAARTSDGKKVLDVVDYNGKDGWKKVKQLNVADLKGYKVTNVRYSKYGNTAILQKDGEEPVRVRIPRGVNIGAENNVRAAIANADEFSAVIRKGKRPLLTEDGTSFLRDNKGQIVYSNENLTQEDIALLRGYQRQALNELGSYGSQMVVPSETEAEKYKPFGF